MTAEQIRRYVESIEKIDTMIENKQEQVKRLENRTQKCTSSIGEERVQTSGIHDTMAEAATTNIDIGDKIRGDIASLENLKDEIISTFECLKVDEYNVLHKKYVQYMTYDEIAHRKKKSKSWATSTHGNALKNLRKVQKCAKLYEIVQSCTKL